MLCISGFELYSRWVPLISTVQCEAARRFRSNHRRRRLSPFY